LPDRTALRVTAVDASPIVALCAGKDCRKRDEFSKVRAALEPRCALVEVECVGICSGPVVVARPDTQDPLVFSKLRSKQHRKDLVRMIDGRGTVSTALAKRAVGKGKRTTALKRVRRALERAA